MALYSEKVMDHFTNPRNVGKIENADGVGEVGNAKCGDIMKIYLRVSDDGIIEDVEALDGLPPVKIHCSVLAEEAVKSAVKDYYDRKGIAYDPEIFKEVSCEHCGEH